MWILTSIQPRSRGDELCSGRWSAEGDDGTGEHYFKNHKFRECKSNGWDDGGNGGESGDSAGQSGLARGHRKGLLLIDQFPPHHLSSDHPLPRGSISIGDSRRPQCNCRWRSDAQERHVSRFLINIFERKVIIKKYWYYHYSKLSIYHYSKISKYELSLEYQQLSCWRNQ